MGLYIIIQKGVIMDNKSEKIGEGEAYAFFNCDASAEQVSNRVKELVDGLPREYGDSSRLELTLDSVNNFRQSTKDTKLIEILDNAHILPIIGTDVKDQGGRVAMKDLKYALSAKYKFGTNRDAADALVYAMNGIYSTYNKQGSFTGIILSKQDDGEYHAYGDKAKAA